MQGTFDRSFVNQVQQANDIVEVAGEHLKLTPKGTELVGLCPFHNDHKPSLYVSPSKQIFKCFACGAGGDVLKFIQMRENLTFPQAIERLAQRAGIKLPQKREKSPSAAQQSVDPNSLAKVNQWAASHFENNLADVQKGKAARDYLAQRHISLDTAAKWRLGLAVDNPRDLIDAAAKKTIPLNLLEQAGLVSARGAADRFVNRLIFPIIDVTERVVAFGGRTLDGNGAKYINSPATALFDKSNCLYGLRHARHEIVSAQTAVVVEGYTDCIMAHSKGCCNVVATLGTSFTPGHARILKRYANKAVLVFDSDAAGIEAANRALQICIAQQIDIKLATVPQGKDPCDFLLSAGKDSFTRLVNDAADVFEFKWLRLKNAFDRDNTLAGRKSAVDQFLQTVAAALRAGNLPAIDRGLIVNRLSRILGLDIKDINAELAGRLTSAAKTAAYRAENEYVVAGDLGNGLSATAQREILEIVLNEPNLFDIVKKHVTVTDFDVPILAAIAAVLFDSLKTQQRPSLAELLAKTESVDIAARLVQLAQAGEEKANFRARLAGALNAMRHVRTRKTSSIKPTCDQAKFLRNVAETVGKGNRRNIGLV